jgi:hypothetical protein
METAVEFIWYLLIHNHSYSVQNLFCFDSSGSRISDELQLKWIQLVSLWKVFTVLGEIEYILSYLPGIQYKFFGSDPKVGNPHLVPHFVSFLLPLLLFHTYFCYIWAIDIQSLLYYTPKVAREEANKCSGIHRMMWQ